MEPKHHHRHRHHRHHDHPHSGSMPSHAGWQSPTSDPKSKSTDIGSIKHAVDLICAALRAIPHVSDRNTALGTAQARLMESSDLGQISEVMIVAQRETDRYSFVD